MLPAAGVDAANAGMASGCALIFRSSAVIGCPASSGRLTWTCPESASVCNHLCACVRLGGSGDRFWLEAPPHAAARRRPRGDFVLEDGGGAVVARGPVTWVSAAAAGSRTSLPVAGTAIAKTWAAGPHSGQRLLKPRRSWPLESSVTDCCGGLERGAADTVTRPPSPWRPRPFRRPNRAALSPCRRRCGAEGQPS